MDIDSDAEVHTPPCSPRTLPRCCTPPAPAGAPHGGTSNVTVLTDGAVSDSDEDCASEPGHCEEDEERQAQLEEFHNELHKAVLYCDVDAVERVWEDMKWRSVTPTKATLELVMRAYYRGCGDPHSAQEIMREVAVWGGFRPSRKAQHHLQMLWQQVEQINGL